MPEMISQVKKRSGDIVSFDQSKIENAITKAAESVGVKDEHLIADLTVQVAQRITEKFHHRSIPAIEEIQDVVEEILILNRQIKIAKSYILYRDQRARLRAMKSMIDSNTLMEEYIQQSDWRVKENSNMGYSLQGLNNHLASTISSNYWLNKVYTSKIREAHNNGDIHLHDLQLLAAYCAGWDLKDLLLQGFRGVSGKIESRPPKHFRTALGQIINFFYTLQGEVAGAEAFSSFDTLLAPFLRYDNLTYKEVKQSLQEFLFNINVPTRVGFQTPFTNITMDMKPSPILADEYVIIGGKPQAEKYGDFQPEMDLINIAFAELMMEGDAKGRVFTFPIPTYNITKDFPWDSEVASRVFEMTAKYGIPYFSNFINSDMNPEDARSMCPLAGDEKVLIKSSRGRGLEYSEIRNVYEGNSKQDEYQIYSQGKFVSGKFNRFKNQKMIKVKLVNGHELKMSEEHLNFVMANKKAAEMTIPGKQLSVGMYLPYSLIEYKGLGGNKDLGYLVGAYAGDGSFDGDGTVVFSLEKVFKKHIITRLEKIALDYFGAHCVEKEYKQSKLVSLKVHSKAAVGLCQDFVAGKERNKCYKARLFATSLEFRQAVFAGHYDTDGGNRNRIYTSSVKMVETLNMLAATLGTATSIYQDNRDGRYSEETNYVVLFYKFNRDSYGNIWFKKNKKLWVKIESIEKISNSTAYCFEVKNDEPIFTIGTTGILTHNCRLRLDNRELRKRGGGLFGANPLTGSIGVVTINLAKIGYLSQSKKEYFQRLEDLMQIAYESLETKREILETLTTNGLYPYAAHYLTGIKERFGGYWNNHFSTIGIIGMNESLLNFAPMKKSITNKEGKAFALEVMDYMRERMMDFQNKSNHLYNLEATPAEGACRRLAKIDRDQYPDIIVANDRATREKGATPYYTNSTHLPVDYTDDIFEALDMQDDIQVKYTGGTVFHAYLGESLPSADAVKNLVKKIANTYHLPYFTITPTFSICPVHGYLAGEHHYCPKCDEEIGYTDSANIEPELAKQI
jgi:ribonucleoside-triphosphate reductase